MVGTKPLASQKVTVVKQAAVLLLGLLGATIMTGLGVWQLGKYQEQGSEQIRARTHRPTVALGHLAQPGKEATDKAFYRPVRLSGHYDNSLQKLLPTDAKSRKSRVLTAFILDSGGAVPVVRGTTTAKSAPAAPSGHRHQTGLLLPSESDSPSKGSSRSTGHSDRSPSVNLAALTQSWKPKLVTGFVTLRGGDAHRQALTPAHVSIPKSSGRLQNGAYALQWWVFAAFSIAMGIKMARDIKRTDGADDSDDPGILGKPSDHAAFCAGQRPSTTESQETSQEITDNRP